MGASGERSGGVTRRQVLRALAGAGLAAAATPRRAAAGPQGHQAAGPQGHQAAGPQGHQAAGSRGRPPSFVFILSDNHRWDALGAMGHPFVRTPHLDRLAREGVHFANAFCTTPLCSPARASFLTGLYARRHGVWNNAERSRWDDDNVTYLELLKRHAGHRTAFIGKWHMPGSGLPRLRGIDRFVTFTIQDGQGRYFDCPLWVDGRPEPSRRHYITEELTDRAIAFIEEAGDAPFCLELSHKAAHYPWAPAPDLAGLYADAPVVLPPGANSWTGFTDGEIWGGFTRPLESAIRAYLETVTSLDRETGRLLARLDALGRGDDTVVLYASDNGFLFGEHRHVELRWPFEEAIRIPFLVRAPGLVRSPGRRAPQMALDIDVAPTLLELAGVPVPDNVQGASLAPVLRDPSAPGRRAFLIENHREFPYDAPSYQGVRTERWLYVEYQKGFAPTLHDVANDPRQTRDLFGTPEGQRVLPELRALLGGLRRGERFDG